MSEELPDDAFKLRRFNLRRAERGAGAAEVEIKTDEFQCCLWMRLRDIELNIKEFGEHPGLIAARDAYRIGVEFPPSERVYLEHGLLTEETGKFDNTHNKMSDPTTAELHSACLSYRHDYGVMDDQARESLRATAREWWRAWGFRDEATER